jgi:hypothetical protein
MFRLAEIDPRPWGLALLLAAGLVVQVVRPSVLPDIPPETVMRPRIGAEAPAPKIPSYPEISQQMIFSPDRGHGVATASADGPPALVGVAAMGAHISTVLRTGDGVDHVVEVGGVLNGWRLVGANDDHAVLQRGAAVFNLKFGGGASPATSPHAASASIAAPAADPSPPPGRPGASR